jgi:hypothetical protein
MALTPPPLFITTSTREKFFLDLAAHHFPRGAAPGDFARKKH